MSLSGSADSVLFATIYGSNPFFKGKTFWCFEIHHPRWNLPYHMDELNTLLDFKTKKKKERKNPFSLMADGHGKKT